MDENYNRWLFPIAYVNTTLMDIENANGSILCVERTGDFDRVEFLN